MPRLLAQQQMTLGDLEWLFHTSRAISAVAELLVLSLFLLFSQCLIDLCIVGPTCSL